MPAPTEHKTVQAHILHYAQEIGWTYVSRAEAERRRDREEFKARVLEWASCSTAGTLSFNDELLGMERDLGDYVIVHELLHFSVPNHGKLWKSLMRAHLGDYEHLEARMKQAAHNNRL